MVCWQHREIQIASLRNIKCKIAEVYFCVVNMPYFTSVIVCMYSISLGIKVFIQCIGIMGMYKSHVLK